MDDQLAGRMQSGQHFLMEDEAMATMISGIFPHGQIVMTPGALSKLPPDEAAYALLRHLSGDWGELGEHDWKANDRAIEHGSLLFSSYVTSHGTRFWIITEHDRSATTILLPGEY
jgi:hypothetical protein